MLRTPFGLSVLVFMLLSEYSLGDGGVESLSACEQKGERTFDEMCICAKQVGENVVHKDRSESMQQNQNFANNEACEAAAEPPCETLCKDLTW